MDVVCDYCGPLKFSGETPGLCCLSVKVKLPLLTPPPEPLQSLLRGEIPDSRHFVANTQKCNGCFQMTSFGADIIEERRFNLTHSRYKDRFTIELDHYNFSKMHVINYCKYIYFMGKIEGLLDQRQEIKPEMKREILQDLLQLLHEHHALAKLFKSALNLMPNDDKLQ